MEGPQWLDERRKGVGGSDIAAIMGLSPWKTAYQVYREKRKEVESWQGNEATEWGKRMEPAIRQWYSDTTGRPVRLPEKIITHSRYPFMLASLDGFTDDKRVVEIKTARSGKGWGEPGSAEVPDYYLLQVQHYMVVTGFEVADIPVSIGGGSPCLYEVPGDRELQELIIEAAAAFWRRVVDGNPPDPVSYADAVHRFGFSSAQGSVVASQGDIAAVEELRSVRDKLKALEEREEELRGKIILSLGERGDTLIGMDGRQLVTYKIGNGRSLFDAKALERNEPEIYQKYVKQTEPSRRFLLKG